MIADSDHEFATLAEGELGRVVVGDEVALVGFGQQVQLREGFALLRNDYPTLKATTTRLTTSRTFSPRFARPAGSNSSL
jgi:hypothetical protein